MKAVRSFVYQTAALTVLVWLCAACNRLTWIPTFTSDVKTAVATKPNDKTQITPEFIQHEPPIMPAPDISVFLNDGCQADDNGYLKCPPGSPPAALDCTYLRTPDPILGALQPQYPLASCELGYDKNPIETSDFFIYEEGCLDHRWVQFIIFRGGQYQYLKREADLQGAFAPIESPEEALSYAVAATGLKPRFDLAPSPEYQYEVRQVEETHIERIDDTFTINLFEYKSCGCGPHPLSMVVVSVNRDGRVFTAVPIDLFRNPELDKICGD